MTVKLNVADLDFILRQIKISEAHAAGTPLSEIWVDADGNVIETIENPKFCGCGQSKEKPLCDGSHKGFLDKKD